MNNFNIKDGIKRFTINGDENKVLCINISDLGISKRAKQAEKELAKIADECSNISENISIDESIDLIDKLDTKVKKIIDYILNTNASEIVFGMTNCLSMYDGQPLFQNFLDAILPEIEKETQTEINKSRKNIRKYTSQVKK